MVKRVPKQNIVKGSKRVLPAGHPLLALYDPSEVIIEGSVSEYDTLRRAFPAGSNFLRSGSSDSVVEKPDQENEKEEEESKQELPDVPHLSDIESVQYIKYFDPVSKIEKAKAIIKIRNSSKNKSNVAGVDVRIYQPRGA